MSLLLPEVSLSGLSLASRLSFAPGLLVLSELVAVVGGTVHTEVPGEEPRPATLLVEDGLVRAVLAPDEVLPDGVERIVDVEGRHVVPGLIDGMVFFDADHDALYVASGVTLVRDLGSDPDLVLQERARQRRDRTPGPSLLTAGAPIDGNPPATQESLVVVEPEAVEPALEPLLKYDLDFLSVQASLSEACWRAVIGVANEHELDVWGRLPEDVTVAQALAAGHDGFLILDALVPPGAEWAFVLPIAFKATAAKLAEHGGAIVPLLSGIDTRLRRTEPNAEQDAADAFFLEHMSPFYEVWWRTDVARRQGLDEETLKVGARVRKKQLDVLALLHEAGVNLLPGSSAPQPWFHPGAGLHAELALWLEAGLPAADILHAATRGAAEILGVEDRFGSLAPGLSADFVVVEDDPRENLATLSDPAWVGLRGRVLDRADLADLLKTLRVEQRRAREEIAKPLEIEDPPLPEGAVVLRGQVETGAGGLRVGGERYAVVREPDGRIAYCGRIVSPGSSAVPPSETVVVQRVRDGLLESFEFVVRQAEHELRVEGLSVAGRMNVRRSFDGHSGDPMSTLERIETVSVGSVTALLMLAQRGPLPSEEAPPYAVLHFHEAQEPEVVPWYLALDERGVFVALTPQANHGFLLADNGALELWEQRSGPSGLASVSIEADALGGPGHPLPAELAQEVAKRRAAVAAAAANAPKASAPAAEDGEPATSDRLEVPELPPTPEGEAEGGTESGAGAGGDEGSADTSGVR